MPVPGPPPAVAIVARLFGIAALAGALGVMGALALHRVDALVWLPVAKCFGIAALSCLGAWRRADVLVVACLLLISGWGALRFYLMPEPVTQSVILATLLDVGAHTAQLVMVMFLAISVLRGHAKLISAGLSRELQLQLAVAETERDLRLASEVATDFAGKAAADRVAMEFEQQISGLVGNAAQAASGMRQVVEKLSTNAAEAARHTTALMQASEGTAQSAQNVAQSVDELAVSITRASAEVRQVSDASFKAMEEAGSTNETVRQLAETATRIGTVVGAISRIAARTNLLALNATIEAARAGDAGRGFAVVANEVKELAQQTARATRDIDREIAGIRSDMEKATTAIDGMANTVAELGGITVSVVCAMEDQAEIAQSIAANALKAASGTKAVVDNLHGLNDQAAQSGVAASQGAEAADRVAENCNRVDEVLRGFVKNLHAA